MANADAPSPDAPSPVLPKILAISLDYEDMVKSISKHLWKHLDTRATVIFASTDATASAFLSDPESNFQAVLLTDSAIIKKTKLRKQVLGYARSGGRVIMCCDFSSMVRPPDFDKFMEKTWDLPWRFGSYHRTDNYLNPYGVNLCHLPQLESMYSMKAVSLTNVESASKIYHPTANSTIQSHVFPPDSISNIREAAVTFTRIGDGWLGYIGDVNSEDGSTMVVLAMAGLMKGACCYTCEKAAAEGSPLLRCARCQKAWYCGTECQKTDWKRHKAVCLK